MRNRRHSAGFVLPFALVLIACATIVLGGTLAYVSNTGRQSAIYADRTRCRLAAHSALDAARGVIYKKFEGRSRNRSLFGAGGALPEWINKAEIDAAIREAGLEDCAFNGGDIRIRVRSDAREPQVETVQGLGRCKVAELFATATCPGRWGGATSVTLASRIAYGVGRSKVFDHAYFVNNYGWFEGSTITANGDVRANGDMSLSQSPKVNGHVYGARNDELGVPGEIKNGTGTMDTRSVYSTTQYGVNNRARPLQTTHGDGGYDAPEKVDTAALNSRLHPKSEPLEMPWISDLNQYVEYAKQQHSTLRVGGTTLIGASDGYYTGTGPSGDASKPDNLALVLEGTLADPIRLNGPVVVSNDVVIKGYVTGQGTIYSARNIHIVGDIKYVNAPDWTGKKAAANSGNATKDLLGLAARGNIVMGDSTSSSWLSSTLNKVLTTAPYVQPYTCAQDEKGNNLDADIGYPRVGQSKFNGNYTAEDGGMKTTETQKAVYRTETYKDNRGRTQTRQVLDHYDTTYGTAKRKYYDSVVPPSAISSRASTITQIDAVLYNNHGIFGNIGSCTINGSLVCRNEGLIFNGKLFLNWDYRLYSGSPESVANSIVGMPVSTAMPRVLSWQEVPDAWNAD